MIVVLASSFDEAAQQLTQRWAAHGACLLTCRDLSTPGWSYRLDDRCSSTACIGGRQVTADEIRGVVTRLPYVPESELLHITAADRSYVAAEMSAFLTFWLRELTCPVLNPPTPGSLNGPCWHQAQWFVEAARVGMRVGSEWQYQHVFRPSPDNHPHIVTVVGERCIGAVDGRLSDWSRALADAANVELLEVWFSTPDEDATFLGATVYPSIDSTEVQDAMLSCIRAK